MKMFKTLAIAAAALVSVPAMAQTGVVGAGAIDAHYDSSALNGSFSFNGSGTGSAESASGFNTALFGSNGGAVFGSVGVAGATANVTPFSSESTSFHAGVAGGYATPNATFNATQVMTFAQSNAANGFDAHLGANFEQSAVNFSAIGAFGILGF